MADSSPRILNLILDHTLGKPPEHIQQEQVVFIISGPNEENKAPEADPGQLSLPERRVEEEGQELV